MIDNIILMAEGFGQVILNAVVYGGSSAGGLVIFALVCKKMFKL